MDSHLIPLRSHDIQVLAFMELINRVRVVDNTLPQLSDASHRIFRDERASYVMNRYLSCNALRVFLDASAVNFVSKQIDQQWQLEMMLRYFVKHQASLAMIQAMFPKTTRTSIERLRAELGAPPASKAAWVANDEVVKIYAVWEKLQPVTDERQRYIELHQQFKHHSLTTMFAVLNMRKGA